jgi:MFS family permease
MFGAIWGVAISIGCSFAQTGTQLIILRAMHGIGPAAMVPAAIGILAHSFPPGRSRSTAFATFSAGAPLGSAMGMVFGGVMAQYAT